MTHFVSPSDTGLLEPPDPTYGVVFDDQTTEDPSCQSVYNLSAPCLFMDDSYGPPAGVSQPLNLPHFPPPPAVVRDDSLFLSEVQTQFTILSDEGQIIHVTIQGRVKLPGGEIGAILNGENRVNRPARGATSMESSSGEYYFAKNLGWLRVKISTSSNKQTRVEAEGPKKHDPKLSSSQTSKVELSTLTPLPGMFGRLVKAMQASHQISTSRSETTSTKRRHSSASADLHTGFEKIFPSASVRVYSRLNQVNSVYYSGDSLSNGAIVELDLVQAGSTSASGAFKVTTGKVGETRTTETSFSLSAKGLVMGGQWNAKIDTAKGQFGEVSTSRLIWSAEYALNALSFSHLNETREVAGEKPSHRKVSTAKWIIAPGYDLEGKYTDSLTSYSEEDTLSLTVGADLIKGLTGGCRATAGYRHGSEQLAYSPTQDVSDVSVEFSCKSKL